MGTQYNQKNNLFQVAYQAPFGGIDTTAYPSAIDPKNFAAIATGVNDANYLKAVAWRALIAAALGSGSGSFLGYIPVAESSTIGYIITTTQVIVLAADGLGGITYTAYGTYAPAVDTYGYFSYVVIDQQLMWTSTTWNEIWTFDTDTNVISLLTNYVGGGYLGVLNNQIINLGGVSNLDGEVPYRISWSAPGDYGQWQPYDVGTGTGSYDAGFNDLPSTSDVLAGIITIGTVAYLFRSQGITQMNPTGNGVSPWQFTHLWASQLGVGSVYPDSIAQYGSLGAFVSDSGIYTLGMSGFSEISGPAKELLYKLIKNIPNFATNSLLPEGIISAVCVPYLIGHPSVYYVIAIANSMTTAPVGVSPSINSYALYAIDLYNGNACYDLGTQLVAVNPGQPSANAVGKVSFINTAYSSAPSPAPPAPPFYPFWPATSYIWPSGVMEAVDSSSVLNLYQITGSGTIICATGPDTPLGAIFPTETVLGTTVSPTTGGSATFTYQGQAPWIAGTPYVLGQYTSFIQGAVPYYWLVAYKCIVPGTSGASQTGWNTTPGAIIIDGTAQWQCLGVATKPIPSPLLATGATQYDISQYNEIVDSSNYVQQDTNFTVNDYSFRLLTTTFYTTLVGGFTQTTPPTWNNTTGGATNETKVSTDQLPAATWVCLGAKPSPPTSLVGANAANLVPLFVAINNQLNTALTSSFAGAALSSSIGTDATAQFTFKKEQLSFGKLPTVSKVGFIAQLIDATVNGEILVSMDGGNTFGQTAPNFGFPAIQITAGAANAVPQTYYSDGILTIERPQLSIVLINVAIAEVYYQGTLAEYDLI